MLHTKMNFWLGDTNNQSNHENEIFVFPSSVPNQGKFSN